VFLPGWGLPRGGLYILAALQASYNCVTVTRRHLHIGLLVATVIAMFAASHFRADWTMLFYLVPFVVAAVFTLVAEQINRRAEDVRAASLSGLRIGGQGAAIASASLVILLLAGFLYAITPQISRSSLLWNYGVPVGGNSGGAAEPGVSNAAGNDDIPGYRLTPDRMRESAARHGMPGWQAGSIRVLATVTETLEAFMAPVQQALTELWNSIKEWLKNNINTVIASLLALMLSALLVALWRLLREAKAGVWLITRWDYLVYGVLGRHRSGRDGALQLYSAMERVFSLHDLARSRSMNVREYLSVLCRFQTSLRTTLIEMTLLFEDARYGGTPPGDKQLTRMRALYRTLYRSAG